MRRKRRICLVLPLNYICCERPRNTGDVPRSARSSAERGREGRKEERGCPWRGLDKQGGDRGREAAGGQRAKRSKSHFQLARETTWAGGPRCSTAFCPLLVSITSRGFWQREGERERVEKRGRERPRGFLRLLRPLHVAPCSSFILRRDREKRETPDFKRQFDVRSTRERNLKEDLRKQLKGAYKGHTVTDTGQWNPCGGGTHARSWNARDPLRFADRPCRLWSAHLSHAQDRTELLLCCWKEAGVKR